MEGTDSVKLKPAAHSFRYHIKGVDTSDGLKRFMNKEDRYEKALKSFAVNLTDSIFECKSLLLKEDYAQVRQFVHKIKGVAGNLGAKNLFSACLEFEERLSERNIDEDALNDLIHYAREFELGVRDAFGVAQESDNDAATHTGKEHTAIFLLNRLKHSAEECDPSASEKIAEELMKASWGLMDDKIKSVCGLIEEYRFDEAIGIICGLLGDKGDKLEK